MVRLVPGQGWQRRQWQRRCWMTLSLFPIPVPHPRASAPCPSYCCERQQGGGNALPLQPIPGCHLSAPDQSHVRTCVPDQSGASRQPGCPWGEVVVWGVLRWGWRHVGRRRPCVRRACLCPLFPRWFAQPVSANAEGGINRAWLYR